MRTAENIIDDFKVAIDIGDHDRVLYLLNNEVSDLLSSSREAVIRAMQGAGMKLSIDMTDDHILEIIDYEIGGGNEVLINKVVERILAEHMEWHNISSPIGMIVAAVGAIVKGIGDAVADREKAKANRDALREQVKAERAAVSTGTIDILSVTLKEKAKSEQALGAEDVKAIQELTPSQNMVKITAIVCSLFLVGLIGTVIVLKSKE